MDALKLDLHNRSALELLATCEQYNAQVRQLPPNLQQQVRLEQLNAAVIASRAAYEEVESLRNQLKAAVRRRNEFFRQMRQETQFACGMVAVNAGGGRAGVLAAGLPLKAERRRLSPPSAPTDFAGLTGDNEGEVKLSWKRPIRRCFFSIEMSEDGQEDWKLIEAPASTKTVIQNLPSGKKLWFRVSAGNARGNSPWSQPVAVRVK